MLQCVHCSSPTLPAFPAWCISEAPCFSVAFWLQRPWCASYMRIIVHISYSSSLKCYVQSCDHCELQICVEYIRQSVQHKSSMVSGKWSVTWNAKKLFKIDSYQFHWMKIVWNSQCILHVKSVAEDSLTLSNTLLNLHNGQLYLWETSK